MMRSIRSRLLLANLVLLPIFLGATGLFLDRSFAVSLDSAASERLQVQLLTLLAEADYEDTLTMPTALLEARFNQPNSGLYAAITAPSGEIHWSSPSSVLLDVATMLGDLESPPPGGRHFGRLGDLYHAALAVSWQTETGDDVPLVFHVLETTSPSNAQRASYRAGLFLWLGGAAFALLLGQALVLLWGLRPLDALAQEITAIEGGKLSRLEGPYPREVQALAGNLNSLIVSEEQRRERTRNTLSDLAHSLKTPLSVIRGADVASPDYAQLIAEQSDHMERIVSYQLQRASGGTHKLLTLVSVAETVDRLCASLQKVYAAKELQFILHVDPAAQFRGDERDLMEILGNLLDNACKYGSTKVYISAAADADTLSISVEDDGPGIPSHLRDLIQARGARADSVHQGQGIGLAVAADIAASYNGSLSIEEGAFGGARIIVVFGFA